MFGDKSRRTIQIAFVCVILVQNFFKFMRIVESEYHYRNLHHYHNDTSPSLLSFASNKRTSIIYDVVFSYI